MYKKFKYKKYIPYKIEDIIDEFIRLAPLNYDVLRFLLPVAYGYGLVRLNKPLFSFNYINNYSFRGLSVDLPSSYLFFKENRKLITKVHTKQSVLSYPVKDVISEVWFNYGDLVEHYYDVNPKFLELIQGEHSPSGKLSDYNLANSTSKIIDDDFIRKCYIETLRIGGV